MVITQVAVSMVLLVGALLFVRSYRNLMTLDPGIRESGISVGYFGFPRRRSSRKISPRSNVNWWKMCERAGHGECGGNNQRSVERQQLGSPCAGGRSGGSEQIHLCEPELLATLGIPLLTGRNFTTRHERCATGADREPDIRRRILRHRRNPLGQHVHVRPEPQYPERTYEIIGTIPDTKYGDLRGTAANGIRADRPVSRHRAGPGMAMMFAARGRARLRYGARSRRSIPE